MTEAGQVYAVGLAAGGQQEGVYVTFNGELAKPAAWSPPRKILGDLRRDGWYPQVIGTNRERRETDKSAGRAARLFVRGESRWEIVFLKPGESPPP